MYEIKNFRDLQYGVFYPEDYDKNKKYPAIVFTHGAGQRGRDYETFIKDEIFTKKVLSKETPLSKAICFVPLCHLDTWFDCFSDLLDFVKEMYNRDDVDQKRFNAAGISMGGYAAYQVMMCLPELFHKAYICCGGGMYWNAGRMWNIEMKIFHGALDEVVYPEESKRMYNNLIKSYGRAELTIYPDCDHNCWDKAYADLEKLAWFVE